MRTHFIRSPLPCHPWFSKQPSLPIHPFQLLLLVQEALHQLLFFFAIGEDFADGLGDEPEGGVLGLAASSDEFRHALGVALLTEDAHPVEHIDQAAGCAVRAGSPRFLIFIRFATGIACTFWPDFSSTPVLSHIISVSMPRAWASLKDSSAGTLASA